MKTAAKTLLALGTLLLALGLGEAAVRAFGLGPDVYGIQRGMIRLTPDPELRYELAPNYVSPARDVQINVHGMRDAPRALAKPPGVRRIACVGDSVCFGMGTSQDPFNRQLELRLGGGSEVLNFGVPGYHVGQVAATLAGRAAAFAPDLALVLYCLNDPQETSRELEGILRWRELPAGRADALRRLWNPAHPALERSRLWQLFRWRLASWTAAAAPALPRYRDDMEVILAGGGEAHYRALYEDPAARARLAAGFDALARWQAETGVPVWVVVFPVFVELAAYRLGDLHRIVAEEAAARGLRTLDLLPVYQEALRAGREPFHADPLHPNRTGYGLAAGAVAEALRSAGWGALAER
jgi:lysophospholipase L1-like esterase